MKDIKSLLKNLIPPKKTGQAIVSAFKKAVDGATAIKLAKKKIKDGRV